VNFVAADDATDEVGIPAFRHEAKKGLADPDDIAILQALFLNLLPIDGGAMGRAEILEQQGAVSLDEPAVPSGTCGIRDLYVGPILTPDDISAANWKLDNLAPLRASFNDQ
jgi:hypothetical protein